MGGIFVPPQTLVPGGVLTLLFGTFQWVWWRIDRQNPRAHLRFFGATIGLSACAILVVRLFAEVGLAISRSA